MIFKVKNILAASLLCATMATAEEHHGAAGQFYVVVKGLVTTSETIHEGECVSLKGDHGAGMGLDFGYTLPYHFALELDTSYSKNSVHESRLVGSDVEHEEGRASYWTYAFDVTYGLPVYGGFALMAKVGYEFEHETIDALEIDADDNGFVYGAGVEYHIDKHYEAIVEYEESTIESPRGSSVYAGLKYTF